MVGVVGIVMLLLLSCYCYHHDEVVRMRMMQSLI